MEYPDSMSGGEVRELRHRLGLTLDKFWLPLGISRGMGSAYELGSARMSDKVCQLVWLHHIASAEEALIRLGKMKPTPEQEFA